MEQLRTTRTIIEALGGVRAVADLTGREYNAALNWTRFSTFPANTYVIMQAALAKQGYRAAPTLWGMTAAKQRAST